ncbi:MAG: OmpA family protein [Alcanivorax nanhaiticus]
MLAKHPDQPTPSASVYTSHRGYQSHPDNVYEPPIAGFHLVDHGIKTPEVRYDFVQRPKAKPGTFIFYFDFASAEVHDDQVPVYDEIVKRYQHRRSPIIVIGETDGFGSHAYNVALAQHRSQVIVDELIQRGIRPDEIELRLQPRCCRHEEATSEAVNASRHERITWVHFD